MAADTLTSSNGIVFELIEFDEDVAEIEVLTPTGPVRILGAVTFSGDELRIESTHIGGMSPGALGRAGLNEIGRAALEVFNVKRIVVVGAARTTGAKPGKTPKIIRFPRDP